MARQKEYREQYTDHCIRHPKDAVSYTTFRWRMRNWGPKLAIRLGKLESAPKMSDKIHEKRKIRQSITLHQKEIEEKRRTKQMIGTALLGITLFGLGLLVGTML